MRPVELSGKRFGRWTVLRRAGTKKYFRGDGKARCSFSTWTCVCDCGTTAELTSRGLLGGKSNSCGCLKRDLARHPQGPSLRRLLGWYRSNAKRRGVAFELTGAEFEKLVTSPCAYTGRPPSASLDYLGRGAFLYNGIDRRDPNAGYTIGNCVPCCFEVNRAKSDLSEAAFFRLVGDIARHRAADMAAQSDLVEVVHTLRQIVCVKG